LICGLIVRPAYSMRLCRDQMTQPMTSLSREVVGASTGRNFELQDSRSTVSSRIWISFIATPHHIVFMGFAAGFDRLAFV